MFDVKQLPAWFQRTPTGKKLVVEAVTDATRTRQKILDEIAAKEKHLAAEDARLKPAVDETHDQLLAADRALTAAKHAHAAAYGEWASMTNSIEHQISTLKWRLRTTADHDSIQALLSDIHAMRERASRLPVNRDYETRGGLSVRQLVTATNRIPIPRELDRLDAAHAAAEALYEVADADVSARIADIRSTMPTIPDLREAETTMEPVVA